jgi:hypothetical protein
MAIGCSAWELRGTAPHKLGRPVLHELRRAATPIHVSKLLKSNSKDRGAVSRFWIEWYFLIVLCKVISYGT